MNVTTDDRGRQNVWAKEPQIYYEDMGGKTMNQVREITNGRWAMVGLLAGLISYTLTGNFFFGVF